MNKTEPLQFTPGKFYRTRDGQKAHLTAAGLKLQSGASMIAVVSRGTHDAVYTYMADGRLNAGVDCYLDLIAEWSDKPEVDWSQMPAWANYIAMDLGGAWFWHAEKPECGPIQWTNNAKPVPKWGMIPAAYCPQWTGDWKASLVQRPKGEGK